MEGEEFREFIKVITALDKKISETKLEDYKPYPFQLNFHNVKDRKGEYARQKFLQAANKIGKTYSAAAEVAWHATGNYPSYYEGIRLKSPKTIQASGVTNETTRKICQAELCGDPEDPEALGTGSLPKSSILDTNRKPGIPNAFESVVVRHKLGHKVVISFVAYEAGFKKFMGVANDVTWLDEEPPADIWSQVLRSQFAKTDTITLVTFTPEEGNTQFVTQINDALVDGQGLIMATWEDAPHIADVPGRMALLLSQLSPHERDMRSKGIPLKGSGLILAVSDEQIKIEPIPIPDHWKKINGMDFGWDHPTAVSFLTYDEENDCVYMYGEYSEVKTLPPVTASAIKSKGEWIPTMWPHDGMSVADKQSGKTMKELYVSEGVNMHDTWFTNPPAEGADEGSGGNGVEAGLLDMLLRMETGRFKVFSTCTEFFKEKNLYHRKSINGQSVIVKLNDDVISATRYGIMSLRHARNQVIFIPAVKKRVGARNW
ncbi:MAG: terminase [Planctomycetes bacterium]|nr:terminase [Planctomycetota bacterium]